MGDAMTGDLKFLIDSHDVISFDIFDTLLCRPYLNPYHTIKHIEKYKHVPGFERARLHAEHVARKSSNREDITFDEIYSHVLDEFLHLKNTELEFEEKLLKINLDMFNAYWYAKKSGKKIAIISDMYLPKQFLEMVLHKNGYNGYDYFYLSCEYGCVKATGNLFECFLNDTGISPKSVLHIGDSIESDIRGAKKSGIDAFHVPKKSDEFLAAYPAFSKLYKHYPDSLEISVTLAAVASLPPPTCDYWFNFGYLIGGPIVYGFSKFIVDTAKLQNKKTMLCIARDGWTLKRVIDIFNIKTKYVYAQRILFDKYFVNPDGIYAHYINSMSIKLLKNAMIVDSGAAHFSAARLIANTIGFNLSSVYMFIQSPKFARENDIIYSTWAQAPDEIKSITSIIEFILMAPEPPLFDIQSDGTPIYQKKTHPHEIARNKIAGVLSDGVVEFARHLRERLCGLDVQFDVVAMNDYVRYWADGMSDADRKMMSSVYCPSNSDHTEYQNILLKQIESYIDIKRVYLFSFIKLFIARRRFDYVDIKLFGFIPLARIVKKRKYKHIKLFNCIKILKIKPA